MSIIMILLSLLAGSAVTVVEQDYPSDPACLLDYARISEIGCCFDHRDNDNDGSIDHADPDCRP